MGRSYRLTHRLQSYAILKVRMLTTLFDNPDPVKLASEVHLRYLSDDSPGIKRVKHGRGFIYLDTNNKQIKDLSTLERIKNLSIPPAWTQVWISPLSYSHLQTTGWDEKGRKQYLYHERWREISQQHKFDKLIYFGQVLPEIRRQLREDMAVKTLNQRKVVATVIWLLEHTYIRIGNETYAEENNHFGLTTLHTKHVNVSGSTIQFEFVGKSGKRQLVDITHPKVAKTIKKLEELPGYKLFQYLDVSGARHELTSDEVNAYLKTITGEAITAKDFRTWGGTVLSAVTLNHLGPFESSKQAKTNITQSVKIVAQHLGNTPTVTRNYYIHPLVPESYQNEKLIPLFEKIKLEKHSSYGLTDNEYAVLTLIKG